jgi:peptidoglycan LD-endopeptidase LytH
MLNARTTPPHLHFGIYVRGEGAVDPWPFLHRPSAIP